MKKKKKFAGKRLVPLLRSSIFTVFAHKEIIGPFFIIALLQLLVLNILYFMPHYPLVNFFGPIIQKMEGPLYIHYPRFIEIVPKHYQIIQYLLYIFVSSLIIGWAVKNIADINMNKKVSLGKNFLYALSRYVHLFIGSLFLFVAYLGLRTLFGFVIRRAMQIRSTSGMFYYIKFVVLEGSSFYYLIIGVFITAAFAFLIPLIILDKKNVFIALFINLAKMWGSYWFMFFVVLLPSMCFTPLLLVQDNIREIAQTTFPEIRLVVLYSSVALTFIVDAIVYTSITTYYLLRKESS